MNEEKPIVLLPGDKRVLDGYTPVIYAGTAITLAVFGFVSAASLVLFLTWFNFPFFPLPESGYSKLSHIFQYFNHWFIGRLVKIQSYYSYGGWMNHVIELRQIHLIAIRHILATVVGAYVGYKFFIFSWKSVDNQRQIRGKKLLKDKEAFDDLKAKWDAQIKATVSEKFPKGRRALIIASDKGFQPNKKDTYDAKAKVIRMPDDQRRTHQVFLGGSRRGKGVTLKQQIMQIYYRILNGAKDKLMIIDTPKGEYGSLFKAKYTVQFAPDEKHSVEYWIARDLEYDADFKSFWAGRIPTNEKEPYWSDSARAIGVAIMVFLRNQCGEDWNFSHFAYWRDQSQKTLIEIAREHYPDALKTLEAPENTVGTHMSTLSVNSADAIELAKIWNGYQHKSEIHQMSVALLKKAFWLNWFINTAYPLTKIVGEDEEQKIEDIPENYFTHYMTTGLIKHLNGKGTWTWTDLKVLVSQPISEQIAVAKAYVDEANHKYFAEPNAAVYAKFIKPIITKAELWDRYEAKPKFSLKEWVLDENPKNKILLIKPSGRFKDQTTALIRGMLFYMAGLINDKYFPEDKSKKCPHIRRFHIVCDEFQALGNLKEFIGPGMEMFASKGVTIYLACQDLSQLKEIYGDNFLKFLQSNTGNVWLMGVNMGESAEMISSQLGKKTILKRHESTTYQDNGKSTSVNFQEHEGVVMTPDEINELGTKIEPHRKYVRYLYIPGNMSNAYILEAEISNYPTLYEPEKPSWMTGGADERPLFMPEEDIVKMLSSTSKKTLEKTVPVVQFQLAPPSSEPASTADLDQPDWDDDFEEEEEIELSSDYGQRLLDEATAKEERKEIYLLPEEEEDSIGGSVFEELAIETVLDSPLLTNLKHGSEVAKNASSAKTTDKKAWLAAMLKKKKEGWDTVDRETER
jgi:hypothetical protein